MGKDRKLIYGFYILAIVVLVFFSWWTYHINDLHEQIHGAMNQVESGQLPTIEEHEGHSIERDRIMLISEGAVFLILLLVGIWLVGRSFVRELRLAEQERNFMLSITHELRSPLASIKLALQTLEKRDMDKDESRKLLNLALGDVDRFNALVDNILMASRMDSPEYAYEFDEFDLTALINEVCSRRSGTSGRQIVPNVEEGVVVAGDEMPYYSMVDNLVENALKYSDGEVAVSLKREEDKVELKVSDQGPGIPDSELLHIFDKFYRIGDEHVRNSKGTGLGLYIVQRVVEGHKGHISVESTMNRGTTFIVSLPDNLK